jgi:hypothetical protein
MLLMLTFFFIEVHDGNALLSVVGNLHVKVPVVEHLNV